MQIANMITLVPFATNVQHAMLFAITEHIHLPIPSNNISACH